MDDWEGMLRQTADDGKLSAGERGALRERLREAALDDRVRAVLRSKAFEMARGGAPLDWLEDVVKLLLPSAEAPAAVDVQFSPGEACRQRIVAQFGGCRRTSEVCVFTITDDRITGAILAAHARGVKVRVVTDNEKAYDAGSDVRRLAAAGVPVRVDASPYHMHHKFAIFDGRLLLTGSYNWTVGAALNNEENLVAGDDRRLVGAFSGEFERLWEKFASTPL